jgi:hypothetical protein
MQSTRVCVFPAKPHPTALSNREGRAAARSLISRCKAPIMGPHLLRAALRATLRGSSRAGKVEAGADTPMSRRSVIPAFSAQSQGFADFPRRVDPPGGPLAHAVQSQRRLRFDYED